MISSFGDGWEVGVLEMLTEDRNAAMAGENDDGLSPSEIIVQRSVQKLGDDSASEMFQLMGCTPEDAVVPLSMCNVLFSITIEHEQPQSSFTTKFKFKVRKIISLLVRFNLLQGNPQDGVSLHDVSIYMFLHTCTNALYAYIWVI